MKTRTDTAQPTPTRKTTGRKKGLAFLLALVSGGGLAALFTVCRVTGGGALLPRQLFGLLSDGFFAAGILLLATGGLTAVANTGLFAVFGYGLRVAFSRFVPQGRQSRPETYYEYKCARAGHKRRFGHFLASGVVLVGLSILFLVLYYGA